MSTESKFSLEKDKTSVMNRRLFGLAAVAATFAYIETSLNQIERELALQREQITQVDADIQEGIDIGERYRYDLFENHGLTGEDVDMATWSPQD